MNLLEKLVVPPDVMAREVGEELVILDLASGSYFGLDSVGTRIWQLLGAGMTPAATVDVLVAEYEVDRRQLEQDLLTLVEKLLGQGLLARHPESSD